MGRLGVTIQGQPFPHLLYHFVLAYSNWEATTLCFSESFESLSLGLQNALWDGGGRLTDRLSSRTCSGTSSSAILRHWGRSSHIQAGKAHENGDVEQAHPEAGHRAGTAARCSRDFASREEYEGFVAVIVARRCSSAKTPDRRAGSMRPLPARRLDDFTRQWVRISQYDPGSPQHLFSGQPVDRRASASAGVGGSGGSLLRGTAPGTDAALARRRQASH